LHSDAPIYVRYMTEEQRRRAVDEAAFRFELDGREWLSSLAQILQPLLAVTGGGLLAGGYRCSEPARLELALDVALHVPEQRAQALLAQLLAAPVGYVARTFLTAGLGSCAEIPGFPRLEVADLLALHVVHADGTGLFFYGLHAARVEPHAVDWCALAAARRQIAAAHRLRLALDRRPVSAAHASGVHASAREGQRPAPRWHVLQRFERHGQRYAMIREESAAELSLLTRRERQVLELVLGGRETKVIAYELGLADATVRVLLARASAKLGARSRHELREKVARFTAREP
jgi:DNA-binding CsgD family transcriptional regulator